MITNTNIDHGKAFDWGRASEDYAKFRDIYPDVFYHKIIDAGLCGPDQTVLDLGTGTGVLPRHLYAHGARFVGADISENQIAWARKLSKEAGMDIEYVVASAEDVEFPAGSFDVVLACQCFMYFNLDIVIPKIHALLKPGGHVCILSMIWLPLESDIAQASENLVLKYNPHWTGAGFRRSVPTVPGWANGLFEAANLDAFDLPISFTRESWHGRMIACRGIGASSLSEAEIAAFEREHQVYLSSVPEPFEIPHIAYMVDLAKV